MSAGQPPGHGSAALDRAFAAPVHASFDFTPPAVPPSRGTQTGLAVEAPPMAGKGDPAIEALRRFQLRHAGVAPSATPAHFVLNRLEPLARAAGLDGLGPLARRIEAGDATLGEAVIEALSTHETYFFRDRAVFAYLEQSILRGLLAERAETRRLRIWSAACSTGQEAYSIAMLIDELAQDFQGWSVEIAASDRSASAITRARAGRYNRFEVQRGLSAGRLLRYFAPIDDDWRIADSLRQRLHFRPFNLLEDFSSLGPCDIILCRNLLLYLDESIARDLLARFARILAPDGFLIVGTAETLAGIAGTFLADPRQPGVFTRRRDDDPHPRHL